MEPIRILMVIGCMGLGGAETMIMNLYRCIDRSKVQFDFLVHKGYVGKYEREIETLGGKIYRIDKYWVRNYFSYVKQLNEHFTAHPEHKIVHCHIGSAASVCLSVAKKYGAFTIAHSHSTRDTIKDLHSRLWLLNSYPTRFIADHFFACSSEAAIDRFGRKIAESDKCDILYNGIDCDRFAFNQHNRDTVRKKLGLEDNFVLGNIGRHTLQKNPLFLLEVFAEVYRKDPTARLLQVGMGELTEQMREKSRELNVEKEVIFAGTHIDVEKYYSAMDVFLFPSLWEGLGMVAVEAQTNGMHVVASDTVPALSDIGTGLFHPVNISQPTSKWAEEVLKYKNNRCTVDVVKYAQDAGYSVKNIAHELEEIYYEMLKRKGRIMNNRDKNYDRCY